MVLSLKDILNGPHEYRNGQYFPLPKPVAVEPVVVEASAQTPVEYEPNALQLGAEARRVEKLAKGKGKVDY